MKTNIQLKIHSLLHFLKSRTCQTTGNNVNYLCKLPYVGIRCTKLPATANKLKIAIEKTLDVEALVSNPWVLHCKTIVAIKTSILFKRRINIDFISNTIRMEIRWYVHRIKLEQPKKQGVVVTSLKLECFIWSRDGWQGEGRGFNVIVTIR